MLNEYGYITGFDDNPNSNEGMEYFTAQKASEG